MVDWITTKITGNFLIGKEDFNDLEIHPNPKDDSFYYFFHKKNHLLVGDFILDKRPLVDYICHVTLIKTDGKFTPRLCLSTRDKYGKLSPDEVSVSEVPKDLPLPKARID